MIPTPPLEHASVAAGFAAVAAARPEAVALRTDRETIRYGDLAARAAAWTRALRGRSTGARSAVVLIAGIGADTVATVLGVFAADHVLVALDPALPAERIRAVLADLAAHEYTVDAIVTDSTHRDLGLRAAAGQPVWSTDTPPAGPADVAKRVQDLQAPTSIQFTSGSTGAPKAVLHCNGLWLCDALLLRDGFGITAGRRIALCMPISFGAGMNVLIGSLLAGAEVLAVDPRASGVDTLAARLDAGGAQIMVSTPSFAQALAEQSPAGALAGITRVVTTGEPVAGRVVRQVRGLAPGAVFTNWVGSSETSAIAAFDIAATDPVPDGLVTAGLPAPHKRIEIDDAGTVLVTSPFLALGYLEAGPDADRFVTNPDGTRTFRTGDRGRFDPDGNLVLLGRADAAVKVRGYLVEPAEVESCVLRHDDVREAVVIADRSGPQPTLIAYIAPAAATRTPSIEAVRARLHEQLPPWMVPAHIVFVAALPRTERGKVDRAALPRPTRGPIEPPRGELEAELATLWAEVLTLDAVGRDENFYALGGDSLTVQRMLIAVTERFGCALGHSDLATAPSVAEFASTLQTRRARAVPPRRADLAPTTVALRPLGPDTEVRPLFCFTGAGASALSFVPLARRVGPRTAVYALQPNGLENRAVPDWTIARAARRHLRDLRRIQPHGPYTLIGHSLGGYIALEVAHRLEALGETVDLVAMLDPFLPPRAVRVARRQYPSASITLDQPPEDRRDLWRRRLQLPLAGVVEFDPETQAAALEAVGVRVGLLHKPTPWSGRALVVLTAANDDDERLWPFVLDGELTLRRLDCDHQSIVREPHVEAVVDMIAEQVDLAERRRLDRRTVDQRRRSHVQ